METTNASSGISRRRFLKIVSGIFTFIGSLILAIPLAGFIIGPISRISKTHFSRVANLKNIPPGQPTDVRYPDIKTDAYIEERRTLDVWVIKHSPKDVTVFSPICPHLGCRYNWHPQKQEFICPCHGSVFAKDGKVLAGRNNKADTLGVYYEATWQTTTTSRIEPQRSPNQSQGSPY